MNALSLTEPSEIILCTLKLLAYSLAHIPVVSFSLRHKYYSDVSK